MEGPFDPDANGDQGYHQKGVGWYRKSFTLPAADRGRYIELQLDGMATAATVWFNGAPVEEKTTVGGAGLRPLDRFDVSLAPGEPAEILRVEAMPGACCGWRMESLSPAPGFVAAVVIGDRE